MTDIINGFARIKNLPTTKVEVMKANHDDASEAVIKITRAEFDPMTGAVLSTKSDTVTKEGALIHRARLVAERDRIIAALADFQAFVGVSQTAIDQWLIDNPKEDKKNG